MIFWTKRTSYFLIFTELIPHFSSLTLLNTIYFIPAHYGRGETDSAPPLILLKGDFFFLISTLRIWWRFETCAGFLEKFCRNRKVHNSVKSQPFLRTSSFYKYKTIIKYCQLKTSSSIFAKSISISRGPEKNTPKVNVFWDQIISCN